MTKVFDENSAYARAHEEALGSFRSAGLWARAFGEAAGDENKTVAKYILLRV